MKPTLLLALVLLASAFAQNGGSVNSVEARSHQLHALFDEQWEQELRVHPEFATRIGDNRYNDRLSDNSPAAIQAELNETRKFLARSEAIDPTGFSPQDRLSRELFIRELRMEIEGAQFKPWEMPVNQMRG